MNGTAIVVCPVCSMQHERTTTRTIFCRCGSAARYKRRTWNWFRWGNLPLPKPSPETQTEARGCAGPECDL